MKIQEIDIKNFRGYGENPDSEDGFFKFKDLDRPDIVLITGHNGYGKTSLYEAVEWCFTDNVKALRKHTETVNGKITLKKSHYLKFQSIYDDENKKNGREVQVRIVFDNGKSLIRTTKCDSLHQDKYSSVLTDEASKVLKEEVKAFIEKNTGQKIDNFFRLSFCGQAYSQNLIHDTSAKERGAIWLSFLGMNEVNEIVNNSDGNKNKNLSNKINQVKNEINNKLKNREKIDTLFELNNWGNVETYHTQISNKIELINKCEEEFKEIGIIQGLPFKNDTIRDAAETLKKSSVLKEKIKQELEKDEQKKRNCIKERLIQKYKKKQKFLQKSEMALQLDIARVHQEKEKYEKLEIHYKDTIRELEGIKLEINSNVICFMEDKETKFLSESMINQYESAKKRYAELYSQCQKYGIEPVEEKRYFNTKRLLRYNNWYQDQIIVGKERLEEKKKALKAIKGVCDSQKDMLLTVQTYVNQSEKIESCPVCGGKDFFADRENPKEKLLSIVEGAISNGNESINTYNRDIKNLEEWIIRCEKSYYSKVWEKYSQGMEILEKAVDECIQLIVEHLNGMISCNKIMQEKVQANNRNLQEKMDGYNEFILEYNLSEKSLDEMQKVEKERIQKLRNTLTEKFGIEENEIQFSKDDRIKIRPLIRRIYLEKKAIGYLEDILAYRVEQENLELLEKYDEMSRSEDKLNEKKEMYDRALEFRNRSNEIAKDIQRTMMEKYIENNDMIKVIYEFINPHPFFRDIKIEMGSNQETNIKSSQRNDIFLDHLFSEAQMKVLSLSVFLGLNLSVQNNFFEQIYIDDPVQSMDDMNMVCFIDLLRAIKASQKVKKNFVIGTHDDNFSKLLKIKFRHHSFIEYHMESYSKEGPRICRISNGLLSLT